MYTKTITRTLLNGAIYFVGLFFIEKMECLNILKIEDYYLNISEGGDVGAEGV